MKRNPKGRLELTWMGKDSALIPVEDGKYDYAWVDPTDPRAREVKSIEVLEQVGEVEGPTGANENLLIIGDSGDALRSLGTIPEYHDKYAGKVKLVYIDPPFNTEQTFEHYADQLEHSIWLTMMRDRIRDIKPLLAEDASVWVHLDDAEVHRMRVLLDEEFGPENFISEVIWQKVYTVKNSAKHFSKDHDTILVYAAKKADWKRNRLPRTAAMDARYSNPDNDPRGPWKAKPLQANKPYSKGTYQVTTPGGRVIEGPPPGTYWRISLEELRRLDQDGQVWWGRDGKGSPNTKTYLGVVEGKIPQTIWSYKDAGHNDQAKSEVQALVPGRAPFATPKPEKLLRRVIEIATRPGDLVLDAFAGSGTTAAVAHKLGRRWLAIELQAETVEHFTAPRLRKVALGKDMGGISTLTERVAVDELPEGVTPTEAQAFTRMVGKFTDEEPLSVDVIAESAKYVRKRAKDDVPSLTPDETKTLLSLLKKVGGASKGTEVDLMPTVRSRLKAMAKTRDDKTVLWEGGGGFTVAKVGPSMYEVDDEDGAVYLSAEATNGAWSKAVAGQLKFSLTPDDPVFCGVRKRQRLAVIDGVADETVVRTVVEHLGEKEKAVIVAKGVLPEAEELLQSLSPGSRIKKAPGDMFANGTVK
ncbi:site-specific DNA-methyltransferase [Janibacter hoylei]|uniref:site-specific DNA-methyltransferase n=1 Tax=Janibacter hoylei TaxID=364298 RepID=UPI0027BA5A1F|nr:site-specific DNA-methyltransferase [Janibacter hoylei]